MSTVSALPATGSGGTSGSGISGPTPQDPFNGLLGVDEMFRHVHAENFYKPFGDKMKELFGDKKLPNGENIISAFKTVYDLGVQAGIATQKLEEQRIRKKNG